VLQNVGNKPSSFSMTVSPPFSAFISAGYLEAGAAVHIELLFEPGADALETYESDLILHYDGLAGRVRACVSLKGSRLSSQPRKRQCRASGLIVSGHSGAQRKALPSLQRKANNANQFILFFGLDALPQDVFEGLTGILVRLCGRLRKEYHNLPMSLRDSQGVSQFLHKSFGEIAPLFIRFGIHRLMWSVSQLLRIVHARQSSVAAFLERWLVNLDKKPSYVCNDGDCHSIGIEFVRCVERYAVRHRFRQL